MRFTFRRLFIGALILVAGWISLLFLLTSEPEEVVPAGPRSPFKCDKISLVYTWVNGSDPEHIKARNERSGNLAYASPENNRFRDLGGLLYSLRSAEKYAPWVKGIFIVTSGQVPSFVDTTHPKIHIVTHDDIFPNKSDLPTFSSNAIEASFHNLPDSVGDCFIYLNDDMFFGNNVTPEDFLDPVTGQKLYKSSWTAPPPRSRMGNAWHRSIAFSNDLLNNIWGYKRSRNYASHGPYFFKMDVLRKMYAELPKEFDQTTAHPFRNQYDVSIPFLYNQFAARYYEHTVLTSINHYFKIVNDASKVESDFKKVIDRKPKTVCMNDGLTENPDPEVVKLMHTFFHQMFPNKSEYELYEDEYM